MNSQHTRQLTLAYSQAVVVPPMNKCRYVLVAREAVCSIPWKGTAVETWSDGTTEQLPTAGVFEGALNTGLDLKVKCVRLQEQL